MPTYKPPKMLTNVMMIAATASPAAPTRRTLYAPVHGPVKIRFLGDRLAPPACLSLLDYACVEIGVDCHLLARHRVQGEPRPTSAMRVAPLVITTN